jgi:hypothetical protein
MSGGTKGVSGARISIREITFSDSSKVALSPQEVIVIVGPNNSGKSEALRGIYGKIEKNVFSPVVSEVLYDKLGSLADLLSLVASSGQLVDGKNSDNPSYKVLGGHVSHIQARFWWTEKGSELNTLTPLFMRLMSTEQRLSAANPTSSIGLDESPTHPLHTLFRNDEVEKYLRDQFRAAFKTDLILNRLSGREIVLHVGDNPSMEPGEDRLSYRYAAKSCLSCTSRAMACEALPECSSMRWSKNPR